MNLVTSKYHVQTQYAPKTKDRNWYTDSEAFTIEEARVKLAQAVPRVRGKGGKLRLVKVDTFHTILG